MPEQQSSQDQTCGWWLSGGWDDESWKSECGAEWTFIDGDPEENGVRFCFSCGKPVVVIDPKE